MEKYYTEASRRGMSYIQYEERKLSGLVPCGIGTAFYNTLLGER
jgi:hypothetical protein